MKAVILAAGMGSRLAPLTNDKPKPLVEVAGKPLLLRTIDRLAQIGVEGPDVVVVSGYREDVLRARLHAAGVRPTVVFNPLWHDRQNSYSLEVAAEACAGHDVIQIEGDVFFDEAVLPRLLSARRPGALACAAGHAPDEAMKVQCEGAEHRIVGMSKQLDPRLSYGEYVGLTFLERDLAALVFEDLARFEGEGISHEYYDHAYHRLAQRGAGAFFVCDVSDLTATEIDDLADLDRAEKLALRAVG